MKKLFCLTLIVTMLATPVTALAVTGTQNQAYKVVAPLEYINVAGIWDDWFIAEDGAGWIMVNFDGTHTNDDVLRQADNIRVAFGYLIVSKYSDGQEIQNTVMGVYTKDFKEILPPVYNFVRILSETQCVGINIDDDSDAFHMTGTQHLIDLTTRKIIQDLGAIAPGNNYYWPSGPDEPPYDYNYGLTVTDTEVLDKNGQVLLDFSPYADAGINNDGQRIDFSIDPIGDLIYVSYNYKWYIFTDRGRLISFSEERPFGALAHGLYTNIANIEQTRHYIIDREGRTVIPFGVFDSYNFNLTGAIFSNNDNYVIVGKNEKYGIISLPDITLPASEWAAADVTAAIEMGIVPDDAKMWWKDKCTRAEFCEMLDLAVQNITGKSLTALADGKTAISFTDCTDPNVLAASALGIVNGMGSGKFGPDWFITREQAASMLARTAEVMGIEPTGDGMLFADASEISGWAKTDAYTVSRILCGKTGIPLMQGTAAGVFSPKGFFTVEQAVTTMLRLTNIAL